MAKPRYIRTRIQQLDGCTWLLKTDMAKPWYNRTRIQQINECTWLLKTDMAKPSYIRTSPSQPSGRGRKHLLHKSKDESIYYINDIPLGTKACISLRPKSTQPAPWGRGRKHLVQFECEMKGNWPRQAQSRFCWICYQILIRNTRKLVSAGPEQILVDLQLDSNWKWKEIGVGWLSSDFGWFVVSLQKSSTFIDLLNPCANVSGFGHVSLQKSSTFIDLLNPRANVLKLEWGEQAEVHFLSFPIIIQ